MITITATLFLSFSIPEWLPLTKYIEQLESHSFKTREQATKELIDHGIKAISFLEFFSNHTNYEVKYRCRLILDNIYRINTECMNIFYLPHHTRFPKGIEYITKNEDNEGEGYNEHYIVISKELPKDIAVEYYLKAWAEISNNEPFPINYGSYATFNKTTQRATNLYVKDLIQRGYNKRCVEALLEIMRSNEKNNYLLHPPSGSALPPGPMKRITYYSGGNG